MMVTITGHGTFTTVYRQPNTWLDYYRGQCCLTAALYGMRSDPRSSHGGGLGASPFIIYPERTVYDHTSSEITPGAPLYEGCLSKTVGSSPFLLCVTSQK